MKTRLIYIAIMALFLVILPTQQGSAAGKLIAAVFTSDQPRYRDAHRAFIKSLEARGYGHGSTEITLQTPNPDPLSWSNAIRKFNAYKPDIIIAYGAGASAAAMKESDKIPVVSADVYSLDKASKGLCGISSRVPMMTMIKTMQAIHPYRSIGVLYTARESGSLRQAEELRKAAIQFNAKAVMVNVTSDASLEKALGSLFSKIDMLVVTESSYSCRNFTTVANKATAHLIPVVSPMPDAAEKGALLSLEISPQEQGQLAAEMAVRILEGANPEHLSLLMPHRVDLVINMRIARSMKLNLPFQALGSATRIIK